MIWIIYECVIMIWIHPRRLFLHLLHRAQNRSFEQSCRRKGVQVKIGAGCILNHCSIKGNIGCEIVVEDNCSIEYTGFCFYRQGGRIIIGEGTTINASPGARTCMFVRGETLIKIGKNCLLAHSIDISTTDFHAVLDGDGSVMNADSSVVIGDHVWIGKRTTINKGVTLPNDSIVGASSVVTKSFTTPNVLIAGNPARIKKQGIIWRK